MGYDDSSTRLLSNSASLITHLVYDGSGNLEYVASAMPGTATSDPYWSIKKLVYSGSNSVDTKFANGNTQFTNIADNYANYSYS